MFMKKSLVGLDIGTFKTRLVHMMLMRDRYELIDYAALDTPTGAVENGVIIQPGLLGEKMGELTKELKLKGKMVISSVAGPQVYIRNIAMPKMKLNELRQAVYYQATTFLPIPVEEAVIDIFPMRNFDSDEGPKTELFFAAVRKQQVESLEECCRIAGLNMKIVDIEPLALNRVIANPNSFKTKAFLYIGATRSGFSVFDEESLLFYRPLALGAMGIDFNQNQANDYFKREVLTEVTRSLEYYNMQFQAYPETIILCGYGSKLDELKEVLSENVTGLVQIGKLHNDITCPQHIDEATFHLLQYEYQIAIGLAMRGGI